MTSTGYGKYFDRLKLYLEAQPFASKITVTGSKDKRITGNFEVTIVETNALIHSNKRGMGHDMSYSQMNAISVHIEDALEA